MLRLLTLPAVLATIASAFALTWIKHDTRQLEARLQAQERQLEKSQNDIAVLRAELGYLTRPERLEPLARQRLGLRPATIGQSVRIEELRLREASETGGTASSSSTGSPP